MEDVYITDETFKNLQQAQKPLEKGAYESCSFLSCDFSNSKLNDLKFIECTFKDCNFSGAFFNQTALQECLFEACKMLGLPFENCSTFNFEVEFISCTLNHSSFYQVNPVKIAFKDCQLEEVDFTEANLSKGLIKNCNLLNATFDRTNLEKTNFQDSYNISLNPENNYIKNAQFSLRALPGLLNKYHITIHDG